MCVGDWRLGRNIRCVVREMITPLSSATVLLPASQQRVGIRFNILTTGDSFQVFVVTPDGVRNIASLGTVVQTAFFTVLEHGNLPMLNFSVLDQFGAQAIVGVQEFFLPESVLNAPVEQFERRY